MFYILISFLVSCLFSLKTFRQFGTKKCSKKFVILLLFCDFIVVNQ